MIISIIGGTDGLGKWFAKYLSSKGYSVIVSGRDKEKGEAVEKELGVIYTQDNIEATKKGDIVILAVPINITEWMIKELAPHVRENCVLMDITSIKEIPTKAMLKYAKKDTFIMPTHPMFGPSTPSLRRQVVILTPPTKEHENNPWFIKIKNFFEEEGARVIIIPPEKHDKIMGVVQGLTHYSYIVLGSTLRELNIDIKESRKYASPIYELMINIIARIIGQNPYLYADIQMHNPQINDIHQTFINECEKIKEIVENNDREAFAKLMKESSKHFGNETIKGMNYSDKAVGAITREVDKLKKSIGKEAGLKHAYSNKVHFGIVKDVVDDFIILDKQGKDLKLSIANTNLMTKEELKQWKEANLKKYYNDISFLFKDNIDIDIILELLKSKYNIEIIDVYKGAPIQEGYKSITFRIYSFKKQDLENLRSSLIRTVENIGGIKRYNTDILN
ncbi:Prephenate dehydrogenase [Methanococcus aeolicus Nankai-3]|uniref:Prephenate dehydrogenase n=1 Tax=Methanococcus aeolicus (strain ATCC BAA-1280 / DSM 17508 / OCM 812 / Nankai-3) TaxID=419665 RepID=A6UVT0_META3|nr:prephenate dehydrogenase [Methanococcus aeolicus]ABR56602.1 Prephenate dehydrogenase [Methanococcus aeolicus Nankai-3]